MDQKDPLVLKRAAPLLHKVRDLSLRRGAGGLRDLCRVFRKERIGPEEFKSEMGNFGVALSGAESTAVFQAFSDAIGYLLLSSFLDGVLSVLGPESAAAARSAFDALDAADLPLTTVQKKSGFTQPRRAVSLQRLISQATFGEDPLVSIGARSDVAAQREFLDVFDQRYYPDGLVVEQEFLAFYAAIAFLANDTLSDAQMAVQVRRQWGVSSGSAPSSPTKRRLDASSLAAGETSHALAQTLMSEALPHKSKFKETRDKIDTPGRIVGYQGHLPTAAEHFGETFHRVEAAIPLLGKHDPDSNATEVPVDPSYGFVRQGNKANHHNFRFA